jgi:hypothetical protein
MNHHDDDPHSHDNAVELPTPTMWPIITAFGLTLGFTGLVTDYIVSLVGLLCTIGGAVGWFTDVFPHPKHEAVPFVPEADRAKPVSSEGRVVSHLHPGGDGHREHIVAGAVHPYSAGIVGGLAGAIAMAIVACIWGVVFEHSLWYPVNLLAAGALSELATAPVETLKQFSLLGLVIGSVIHFTTAALVGLLYTVLLPMLPAKREWIWGYVITPALWTALIFFTLRFINPVLNERINWLAFLVSQLAFGAVCGFLVYRSTRVDIQQSLPMSARLGVEAQHPNKE